MACRSRSDGITAFGRGRAGWRDWALSALILREMRHKACPERLQTYCNGMMSSRTGKSKVNSIWELKEGYIVIDVTLEV